LPVVDDAGRIRGIVTTTDLLTAFQALQRAVEKLPEPSTA
jgi:CBS-domain-containing membrane protein